MNNLQTKLKVVYGPFLIVSIGTILFYNLLRWWLDIKLGVLPLKEDVLNFWLPFFLPWIPVLIWLRPRIRILKVQGRRDNGHFFYQFVMVGAIAAPIIISQNYIEKASYDKIKLFRISEVKNHRNEKYFDLTSFAVDQDNSLPYFTARTSGRRSENLNFNLYFSCPFEDTDGVWYGVKYSKTINNRSDDKQKDLEYRRFVETSERRFQIHDFHQAKYFEKVGYSDDRDGFLEAIKKANPQIEEKEQVVLIPKTDNFDQRLGTTFPWIFGSFGIGAFILLLMTTIPKIYPKGLNDFRRGKPIKDDELSYIWAFLDPRGAHPATAILILLNIIAFLVMTFYGLNIISPTARELLDIGGNRRFEVVNGEYWRLLSSVFLHGGLLHLVLNLFGIGICGYLLEKILGQAGLFVSFIICGLLASLASISWHENIVSVGASGAIFGWFGLILAFTVFKIYSDEMRGITWVLLTLYAGISLLFGLLGGVDNAAHIGGLISGFVLGGLLVLIGKENLRKRAGRQ